MSRNDLFVIKVKSFGLINYLSSNICPFHFVPRVANRINVGR